MGWQLNLAADLNVFGGTLRVLALRARCLIYPASKRKTKNRRPHSHCPCKGLCVHREGTQVQLAPAAESQRTVHGAFYLASAAAPAAGAGAAAAGAAAAASAGLVTLMLSSASCSSVMAEGESIIMSRPMLFLGKAM